MLSGPYAAAFCSPNASRNCADGPIAGWPPRIIARVRLSLILSAGVETCASGTTRSWLSAK